MFFQISETAKKKAKKKKANKGNIKSESKLWLIFNVKLMVADKQIFSEAR